MADAVTIARLAGPDRIGAAALGLIAACLWLLGWGVGVGGSGWAPGDRLALAALCAGAILTLTPATRGAAALLAIGGTWAVAAPLVAHLDDLPARLSAFRFWPEALSALAAGLAALALGRPDPSGVADIPLGAALAAAVLTAMASLAPEPVLRLLARGPVHVALLLAAGATASVLIRAAVGGVTDRTRRFAVGLAGLLPLMGFMGTVLGIMTALRGLPALFEGGTPDPAALSGLLGGLSGAFETTLIGLGAAVAASLALALIESAER